jgi:transposase
MTTTTDTIPQQPALAPAIEVATRVRNYRYRINPTRPQAAALLRAMRASRRLWNHAVTAQDAALASVRAGRKERVVSELRRRYLEKRLVGVLSVKCKRYMAERGLTLAEAREAIAKEQAEKQAKFRRSLAVQSAVESCAHFLKHHWPRSASSLIYWGTIAFYADAAGQWAKGKKGELKRKRARDSAPLRWQVAPTSPWLLSETVRLAAFGQITEAVECVVHRPLPKDAKVKQLSVTRDGTGHWYLTVAIECPLASVAREFPTTGRTAGINPGLRLRLVAVDAASDPKKPSGQVLERPEHRQDKLDRRLARLLRKADRQVRAGNPECFDEKGRWKKGARAKVQSAALKRNRGEMAAMQQHAAEVRRDHYHKAAVQLLRLYDNIVVGSWRPADTREKIDPDNAPGAAIRRKATNKKAYRQAISTFVSALKDKASLTKTTKVVTESEESNTTKQCPVCNALTGPSGTEGLKRRTWECPVCLSVHNREKAAAWNIAHMAVEPKPDNGKK